MTTVRLRTDPDEDEPGVGTFEFETIPRAGESIQIRIGESIKSFRVEKVEHRISDPTKPAVVHLLVG